MKKKQYKTGESQRKAAQTYRERHQMKNFCVTVSIDEYERDRATLTAHGLTPLKFWRLYMERLNAEPLPNPDNGKENENPD